MSNGRPYYRRRSLFGPLLVAAIGVLILLGNFGVISYHNFGWWFARYWPLLLIFWGMVKFLEYLWARQRNEPYSGVGAGGVVFVVFLILFGMAATGASRTDWGWIDANNDWDGWGFLGTRYDFTESFTQPMATGDQVRVTSKRGDITITPSPDDQAHVVVHKYLRAQSQAEANQFDSSAQPKFEQQGAVWLLDLTGGSFSQGHFDLVVQLPAKFGVTAMADHGDIHISQMQADLDVETNHGDLSADQIKGNVSLRPHGNDVTIAHVSGNVTIDGNAGDSTVSEVAGALTFSTNVSGDIRLTHVAGPVHFRSSRTDLQFGKLDGDLNMDSGDLHANAIAGPFILSTRTKDIHLEDVTGSIHIDDNRGDIEVRAKAPLGNVDIMTTGGEIDVALPEKPGFQVNAESRSGEIESDFGISVSNQSNNATAVGTVGNGASQVKLRTDRGTIKIRRTG